ncbi:MAG: hypothetical protein KatS3mg015_0323 [Fimbriimonadales bacterium]|nr:MAG: hypothetical protein KatS3mg015_0323 [Fimbriimonadales bacterium]
MNSFSEHDPYNVPKRSNGGSSAPGETEPTPPPILQAPDTPESPGGMKREVFWMYYFPASIVLGVARATFGESALAGYVLFVPILMWMFFQRLKNLGYEPLLAGLLVVPIANIWLIAVCLFGPENFARVKKLDRVGNGCIIGGLLGVVLFILLLSRFG